MEVSKDLIQCCFLYNFKVVNIKSVQTVIIKKSHTFTICNWWSSHIKLPNMSSIWGQYCKELVSKIQIRRFVPVMNKELPFRKTVVFNASNKTDFICTTQAEQILLEVHKRQQLLSPYHVHIQSSDEKCMAFQTQVVTPGYCQDTRIPPSSRPPIHPCKIMLCVWCQVAHQQGKWSLWTCTLQHLATRIATEGASTLFLRGNIKLHAVQLVGRFCYSSYSPTDHSKVFQKIGVKNEKIGFFLFIKMEK